MEKYGIVQKFGFLMPMTIVAMKSLNPLLQEGRTQPRKIRTKCQELGLMIMSERNQTPLARK
jgi:hypothetical protein